MSFFVRVKSMTYTPNADTTYDDVRAQFNAVVNNYDLTSVFNTTKYEKETIEFDENDIGAWLCVNTMTSSFEMDNYDATQPCCNSADMLPYMLSDGTWLGDILPYMLDPNGENLCRYGSLRLTFSNDCYVTIGANVYSRAIDINGTSGNKIPSINCGMIKLYNSSDVLLGNQALSSSYRYLKVLGRDLYSSANQTKISSGLFLFNLTPDFNSINDAQSLSDAYRDLEVDYDFNNNTGNYKAPILPLIRIMFLNDKIDTESTFDYAKGVIMGAINKSDNNENMPNYLDSLSVQYDGYFNLIRNNQEATWLNANESLSESGGFGNNNAKDGWYFVNTNKNNNTDNIFSLLKNTNKQNELATFFDGMESSTTPITPGGGFGPDSGPGGGGGNFDNSSEDIDFPSLPSLSAVSTGFTSIYNPSNSQVNELSDALWSTDRIEQIKQLWVNPMDAIMGLSITFAPIPPTQNASVKIGTIDMGVQMPKLQSQYSILDCGTINVNEYWGNFLDYTQTSCYIYLPFIGIEELAIKDVMGATIHVQYHCDVLSGSCVAFVKCTKEELNSVIYNFSGNCNTSVPVSRLDMSAYLTGTYNTMSGISRSATNYVGNMLGGVSGVSGGVGLNIAGLISSSLSTSPLSIMGDTADILAKNTLSPKETIQRSGSIGSSAGLLSIKYPYLILTRPKQQKPANYESYYGLTSHITKKLGECIGFTKVANIHLDGVTATDQEKDMIMSALTSGVFL